MNVNYYSIKDLVTGHFGFLVSSDNDKSVLRDASVLVGEKSVIYSKFPNDYDLYHIGVFNTETGEFTNNVYVVCNLSSLVSSGGVEND